MQRTLTAMLLLVALGCVTNRPALDASKRNAGAVTDVKLGQTRDEVRAIMRKGPESTTLRVLPDGANEEVWNYLTDYDNDMNTNITFRNGKVVELTQSKWIGNGKFDEPLGAVRPPSRTSEQAARIETLDAVIHPGMTRKELTNFVGVPAASVVVVTGNGNFTETATYVGTGGKTFVVTLTKNVVSQIDIKR